MDPTAFDILTRWFATDSTRRRLLRRLVATLPMAGVLVATRDDAAEAERPHQRLGRRTQQRNRNQRNNNRNNNKKNNQNKKKNKGGGLGGSQCSTTGSVCEQNSDCCTNNCFNFACANKVTQCSDGGVTTPCRPPANGCAGAQCCHGSVSCNEGCCPGSANQCNPAGNCCVPNCAGRQCGDDGCGNGETCGNCNPGQTCNETTGQCTGPTCNPESCPDGCCQGAACVLPEQQTNQTCGGNGAACAACGVGGVGGVCRSGACHACSSDAECGAGLGCLNGGCFRGCPESNDRQPCGSCENCHCNNLADYPLVFVCMDTSFPAPAVCDNSNDCPAGTVCSQYVNSASRYLCLRPCPCS
jgi:hypothetical protein